MMCVVRVLIVRGVCLVCDEDVCVDGACVVCALMMCLCACVY